MMRPARAIATLPVLSAGLASHWAALLIAIMFVGVQSLTLDYGTRINDLPHIQNYRVSGNVTEHSGLERKTLIGSKSERPETLDLWMTRFKLYTIDADEVYNVIALARIRPAEFQFDPHYYQYGGAFLYPLGAYFFALAKLGVLSIGSFEQLLANPQQVDRVWIAGRLFVLLAVTLSGLLLYLAIAQFAPRNIALAGLAIFFFCPATVMFSQVLKPHWYALLFANTALLVLVRAFVRARLTRAGEIALGITLGLTVGSVITFGLFAILASGALFFLFWKRYASADVLVRVPIIAIIVFVATNPYYILDWQAVQTERTATAAWYVPMLGVDTLPLFFRFTILPGFGVILTIVFFIVLVRHLLRPAPLGARLFGLAILIPLLVMASLTATHYYWHSNFRYLPYVLPLMIVFLAIASWPYRKSILMLTTAATIVQAIPMKLAYFDENSDVHSTRLSSAAWIDRNVPPDDPICIWTETPAPFSLPPFRFDRHKINSFDCKWLVVLDGNLNPTPGAPGWSLAREFRARLSPTLFPLVWEHVNPQVAVYRRAG